MIITDFALKSLKLNEGIRFQWNNWGNASLKVDYYIEGLYRYLCTNFDRNWNKKDFWKIFK